MLPSPKELGTLYYAYLWKGYRSALKENRSLNVETDEYEVENEEEQIRILKEIADEDGKSYNAVLTFSYTHSPQVLRQYERLTAMKLTGIKDGVKDAIQRLKRAGVSKTVMLTGDRRNVAEAVAKEIGLDEVHAQLLPGDKVDAVESLMKFLPESKKLAFVGDGINDAPVLSRADVGIAMGSMGSDAAIEAADVVLMDDDPGKIADIVRISRKTMGIVMQNIVFALGVKFVVLAMGAFGVANMWEAVFADVGVSVIAILNAMRALKA